MSTAKAAVRTGRALWQRWAGGESVAEPSTVEDARAASYPPPYPDGWYMLARSHEVRDRPVAVEALGRRFVVYRSDVDGRAAVLDAWCPHLGADLSDGVVRDGCIECPFHRWRFRPDGCVDSIPYSPRVPTSARAESWPVDERYGMILAYHQADRNPRRPPPEPPYALPRAAGLDAGTMVHRGFHDAGIVRMHIVEFAENSADLQHFGHIHGEMMIPWTRVAIPGMRVRHDARWETDPDHGHIIWFRNEASLEFFGRPIPRSGASAAIQLAGPGGVARFTFDIPDVGSIVMFQTHTPVAPLAQHVRFTWFSEPRVPRLLASYVVGSWVAQWGGDIRIWERKAYRDKPMLVPGDGPMLELRRWYRQFYPAGA